MNYNVVEQHWDALDFSYFFITDAPLSKDDEAAFKQRLFLAPKKKLEISWWRLKFPPASQWSENEKSIQKLYGKPRGNPMPKEVIKVQLFWESHKNLAQLSIGFEITKLS